MGVSIDNMREALKKGYCLCVKPNESDATMLEGMSLFEYIKAHLVFDLLIFEGLINSKSVSNNHIQKHEVTIIDNKPVIEKLKKVIEILSSVNNRSSLLRFVKRVGQLKDFLDYKNGVIIDHVPLLRYIRFFISYVFQEDYIVLSKVYSEITKDLIGPTDHWINKAVYKIYLSCDPSRMTKRNTIYFIGGANFHKYQEIVDQIDAFQVVRFTNKSKKFTIPPPNLVDYVPSSMFKNMDELVDYCEQDRSIWITYSHFGRKSDDLIMNYKEEDIKNRSMTTLLNRISQIRKGIKPIYLRLSCTTSETWVEELPAGLVVIYYSSLLKKVQAEAYLHAFFTVIKSTNDVDECHTIASFFSDCVYKSDKGGKWKCIKT